MLICDPGPPCKSTTSRMWAEALKSTDEMARWRPLNAHGTLPCVRCGSRPRTTVGCCRGLRIWPSLRRTRRMDMELHRCKTRSGTNASRRLTNREPRRRVYPTRTKPRHSPGILERQQSRSEVFHAVAAEQAQRARRRLFRRRHAKAKGET